MGTNFFFFTKNRNFKQYVDEHFPFQENCIELVDDPDFGYEMHIAKTSAGWLPLFQSRPFVKSVAGYKDLYEKYGFEIYDEYKTQYTWEEFNERVLKFNGGVKGAIPETPVKRDRFDNDMPLHVPVSHFEYGNGKYAHMYTKDPEGYEFMDGDFS